MICEGGQLPQNLFVEPNNVCQLAQVAVVGGTGLVVISVAINCLVSFISVRCENPDFRNRVARPLITCSIGTGVIGLAIMITGLAVRSHISYKPSLDIV
jgi:hypothetical protein